MSCKYLLDSNIFIQAKNDHYGFDFCPAFWDWLILKNNSSVVGSLDSIKKELLKGKDYLSEWVRDVGKNLFIKADASTVKKIPIVNEWVEKRRNYSDSAKADFFKVDFQLVAYALAHDCIVVSREQSAKESKKRVKIPDVCEGLGVRCVLPYTMLQNEQARFVLGTANP